MDAPNGNHNVYAQHEQRQLSLDDNFLKGLLPIHFGNRYIYFHPNPKQNLLLPYLQQVVLVQDDCLIQLLLSIFYSANRHENTSYQLSTTSLFYYLFF